MIHTGRTRKERLASLHFCGASAGAQMEQRWSSAALEQYSDRPIEGRTPPDVGLLIIRVVWACKRRVLGIRSPARSARSPLPARPPTLPRRGRHVDVPV